MTTKKTSKISPLVQGQIFQLGEEQIHIVQVGKLLAHYKRFASGRQKAAPVQLMKISDVQSYLKKNKAKLLKA
jgi:hypothetical protein